MSFDSGSMSFRVFEVEGSLSEDSVAGFAANVVPPINTLLADPISGWVGPRHLLDREITPETVLAGNYLHLATMKAERKVPASLLRAECKLREIAEMKRRDLRFLNRKDRAAIKKEVHDELLPTMPPTLSGFPVVFRLTDSFCAAQALTDNRHDALLAAVKKATGLDLVQWTPEIAAWRLKGLRAEDLEPARFAPESSEEVRLSPGIGLEFLTWLWYLCDERHGLVNAGTRAEGAAWAMMLEGPLSFVVEGEGAHTASLRDGNPLASVEAKAALAAGKKLRGAKLTLAQGDATWSCTLDAMTFTFRSLKVPKGEGATPEDIFQDRMEFLKQFLGVFWDLYCQFLDLRADAGAWSGTEKDMQRWVASREARA